VDAITSASGAPGGLQEPWSVAVDADGFVYVADTWHHRIQKFGPDLKFISGWGQPRGQGAPGPLDLYGPRDIAIAPDGTLWVTDTGDNRVLHFSSDGLPLESSSAATFAEPVGLTTDGSGGYLVADAWSGRVLRFGSGMTPSGSFNVPWTSRDVPNKPYLAVLKDGRIVASVPERGRLYLYDASGKELGSWQPLPSSRPIGVSASADGGFVFTDAAMNQVQIVPAAAMGALFK
jgi:DNA-binding beta-propeller fold protein YncE